jgi:hypothetical protein
MYLHEAVKKAKESGRGFTRPKYVGKVWFIPTNIAGIIISTGWDELTPRWQPSADDLMANDWTTGYEPNEVTDHHKKRKSKKIKTHFKARI